jgi:uncharacterized membrane protein
MRHLWVGVTFLAVAGLAGCSNESQKGGPGAVSDARTFTLSVPGETNVKPGKREEVTISIDRGKEFTQDVRLEFKKPAGVQVIPADPVIKSGESQVKVFIGADDGAAAGAKTVEVIGKPETGKTVSVTMKVDVG